MPPEAKIIEAFDPTKKTPSETFKVHTVKSGSFGPGDTIEIVLNHFWFKKIKFSVTHTLAGENERILELWGQIENFEDFHMVDAVLYMDKAMQYWLEIFE